MALIATILTRLQNDDKGYFEMGKTREDDSKQKTGRIAYIMQRYGLGKTAAQRLGEAAGARIEIGGSRIYDIERIDRYLEKHVH